MSDTSPTPTNPLRSGDDRLWKIGAVVAGLLLVAFIAFVATRTSRPRPVAYPVAPVATLPVGGTAPAFALPRLGGGPPVTLAATRGTPTVVNFFASWCKDCQAEIGYFATLSARTAGHVNVIGIDANDADGSAARALLANAHATYPVGVDSKATTATAYLLTALPVTFFLDGRGRVAHVALGTQTLASLTHWTDALTAAAAR
jgi:thiol-disulfide isomerase/thioredoxin